MNLPVTIVHSLVDELSTQSIVHFFRAFPKYLENPLITYQLKNYHSTKTSDLEDFLKAINNRFPKLSAREDSNAPEPTLNWEKFFRFNQMVLSGSQALQILLNQNWDNSDIDIYCFDRYNQQVKLQTYDIKSFSNYFLRTHTHKKGGPLSNSFTNNLMNHPQITQRLTEATGLWDAYFYGYYHYLKFHEQHYNPFPINPRNPRNPTINKDVRYYLKWVEEYSPVSPYSHEKSYPTVYYVDYPTSDFIEEEIECMNLHVRQFKTTPTLQILGVRPFTVNCIPVNDTLQAVKSFIFHFFDLEFNKILFYIDEQGIGHLEISSLLTIILQESPHPPKSLRNRRTPQRVQKYRDRGFNIPDP